MLLEEHNRKFASSIFNQLTKFRAIANGDYLFIVAKVGQNGFPRRIMDLVGRGIGTVIRSRRMTLICGDCRLYVVGWYDVANEKAAVPGIDGNRRQFA